MRKKKVKPQTSGNGNRQRNPETPQSDWPVVIAILCVAAILCSLVMQAQKRLESELHRIAKDAVQAKARVVDLERAAANLSRELKEAYFKRNGLARQLDTANSRIENLSEIVDAAEAANKEWQTRWDNIRSELESTKRLAEEAKAEAGGSKNQVASLKAKVDEANARRDALQTKLQVAHSDVKQLRSELNKAQSALVDMQSRLQKERNKQTKSPVKKLKNASPLAQQRYAMLERDYLIRTIAFEASGETKIGKAAVAHVVLNRVGSGRWGDRIQDVVTHPWQFEPWMTRNDEIKRLSSDDPRYLEAAETADAVLLGRIPDPTAGATHFLNPVVVRQRRNGSLPSWADSAGQPIGRHVFYVPERAMSQGAETRARQHTSSFL